VASVTVASVGARTPVGLCADACGAAVRAGLSRISLHPFMVDKTGDPLRVAMDGALEIGVPLRDRLVRMATSAIEEAIEPLSRHGRAKISMYVALPEERPGFSTADGQWVMQGLTRVVGASCDLGRVLSFPRGHAGAALAIELAAKEIESGAVQWVLVGGVDSYLDSDTIDWLDRERQLLNEANRLGFLPGEGAGFVLLCGSGLSRTIGLHAAASLVGIGTAVEPKRIKTDTICIGEGLTEAIRRATAPLRLPEQKIVTTYCDINGERYRSEEFLYVPLRHWGPFVDANTYEAPADCWGDVGAASIPLYITLSVVSARRRWARGRHVLVWASSEGGTRGAITLELPEAKA
jgi:3-oxoacyl-[acyl-carrier-protein] synthase-1